MSIPFRDVAPEEREIVKEEAKYNKKIKKIFLIAGIATVVICVIGMIVSFLSYFVTLEAIVVGLAGAVIGAIFILIGSASSKPVTGICYTIVSDKQTETQRSGEDVDTSYYVVLEIPENHERYRMEVGTSIYSRATIGEGAYILQTKGGGRRVYIPEEKGTFCKETGPESSDEVIPFRKIVGDDKIIAKILKKKRVKINLIRIAAFLIVFLTLAGFLWAVCDEAFFLVGIEVLLAGVPIVLVSAFVSTIIVFPRIIFSKVNAAGICECVIEGMEEKTERIANEYDKTFYYLTLAIPGKDGHITRGVDRDTYDKAGEGREGYIIKMHDQSVQIIIPNKKQLTKIEKKTKKINIQERLAENDTDNFTIDN